MLIIFKNDGESMTHTELTSRSGGDAYSLLEDRWSRNVFPHCRGLGTRLCVHEKPYYKFTQSSLEQYGFIRVRTDPGYKAIWY